MPKRVEFFQDKVHAFPEQKDYEKELQRQVADLAARRAEETLLAAVSNNVPSVIKPAKDTARLSDSVSQSLGPPKAASTLPADQLSRKLDSSVAALNDRVEEFKRDNNENAGKKIEGTGFFQIGYFSMWLMILVVAAIAWAALKIYGMVNPVVGLGTNVVGRVSSAVLKRGVSEISRGGEWFKEYLKESDLDDKAKAKVLDLFSRAQVESQSEDVQTVVEGLTKK